MDQMDHYLITGPERIERVREPVPTPGPGEVLVRLAYTAISPGSNVFAYRTGSYADPPDGRPTEALYMGSGEVVGTGAGVEHLTAGDRVAVQTGHQTYAVVPAATAHVLPPGLDPRDASLAYLSGWAVSALHLGRYAAAETVVVVGQGLVGASAALVANGMGARVLALEPDPVRADLARRLDLGAVVQPGAPDAGTEIAHFLGDHGPDLILETSGAWSGLRQAVMLARDYTRIAIMGIYRQPPPADLGADLFRLLNGYPSKFHYGRLQIVGCGSDPDEIVRPNPYPFTRRSNFAYVLEQAARGRLPLGRLVTHCLPPDDIEAALARLAGGDTSMIGVVFAWPPNEGETAT